MIETNVEAQSIMDLSYEWKVVGHSRISTSTGHLVWFPCGDIRLGSLATDARDPNGRFSFVQKRVARNEFVAYARLRP